MTLVDHTGKRFGRWTALHRAPDKVAPSGRRRPAWLCECDCGARKSVNVDALVSGDSKSCGCFNIETVIARSTRHGLSWTQVHNTWCAIKQRCRNPKSGCFRYYGARGIKVCERWNVFENFLQDMGFPPSPDHSIERKNNDGDYRPDNCKWATRGEQNRNRRSNHWVTIDGERKIVVDWARISGTHQRTITLRLSKGCSEREAVFGK